MIPSPGALARMNTEDEHGQPYLSKFGPGRTVGVREGESVALAVCLR